jgi:hypothetical protein
LSIAPEVEVFHCEEDLKEKTDCVDGKTEEDQRERKFSQEMKG